MAYKFWNFARRVDNNTSAIYAPDGVQLLIIDDAVANQTTITGQSATSKKLRLRANQTDAGAAINLVGGDGSSYIRIFCGGDEPFNISYVTPDAILEGKVNNKNIFLKPMGSGLVKFGTYTASGDAAAIGHIDILDAAGNSRKLMVKA